MDVWDEGSKQVKESLNLGIREQVGNTLMERES